LILGAECVERVAAWIADLEIPVEIWLGNDPGRDETSPVEIAGAHSGYVAEMKIEVDERGGQLGP
jgi:hypothetical protein